VTVRTPSSATSRTWNGQHLVLSHFTLDRHHDIADRVAAAAGAGYDGMGLYIGDWMQLCRYIQAIGPVSDDPAVAAADFGALCDRAAEHGLVVGLEFLPFTNVYDADDGRVLVEAADRPNGGLCVDIWHHARGSNDVEQLRRLSAEHIAGIQMNDGPLLPTIDDYVPDCLRFRVPPGEGEMGAVDFVTELLRLGADVPWQLEVCNDDVWGKPALAHVTAAAEGMRRVLTEARARLD